MAQEFHGDACGHYDDGRGRCVDCGALMLGFDVADVLIKAQNIARRPFAFHPAPELADQLSQLRLIGGETSGALRRRLQAQGIETYSCDLLPSEDGGEEMAFRDGLPMGRHLVGDMFDTLDNMWANDLWPHLAIFHITCTYLTCSAEWAYADPDFVRYPGVGYHQRVKPGTLTGEARRTAREAAKDEFRRVLALPISRKVVENPVGALSQVLKPSQIIQPWQFGDDASKATCLWHLGKSNEPCPDMNLPLDPAKRVAGRIVNGRERWGNQTDSGQNRLSPGDARWKDRSRTFPGVADAMASHYAAVCRRDWEF